MNKNASFFLLIFILVSCFSTGLVTPIFSQEAQGDFGAINPEFGVQEEYRTEDVYDQEETLIREKEDTNKVEVTKKPTSKTKKEQTAPSKKSSSGAGYSDSGQEEESVLSYNFLYYIIQKFKFTEIADQ